MAKLYFYYSAMNAGKTTSLLQSSYNYRERGLNTLLLTPRLDHRDGVGVIASRVGLAEKADVFDAPDNLYLHVQRRLQQAPIHCVLVDEAQFLSREQVYQLSEVVDELGIPVLCYGLRTDFRGELFEGSQYLLAWADELKELKTICHSGRKATMVVRVDEEGHAVREGQQVEVGGNERYVSVSRAEFKKIFHGQGRIQPVQQVFDFQQSGLPDEQG